MIELVQSEFIRLKDIASGKSTTDNCNYRDCEHCLLSCFNNEKNSCQEIAKQLLELLAKQKKVNDD